MKKTKNNIKRGNLPTGGFYKTPRSIRNMHLYYAERFDKYHAYHDLLLKAHHSDDSFEIHGTKYNVKRGQVAISRQKLAAEWQWSINTVRKYLDSLQKRNFLITNNASHLTVITMLFYDSEYYGDNQLDNQCDNQSDNSLEGIKKGGEGETTEEEEKDSTPTPLKEAVKDALKSTAGKAKGKEAQVLISLYSQKYLERFGSSYIITALDNGHAQKLWEFFISLTANDRHEAGELIQAVIDFILLPDVETIWEVKRFQERPDLDRFNHLKEKIVNAYTAYNKNKANEWNGELRQA